MGDKTKRPGRLDGASGSRALEEVFEVDYPARTTAAPRAKLRIGITMGIRVEANIDVTLVYEEPSVK